MSEDKGQAAGQLLLQISNAADAAQRVLAIARACEQKVIAHAMLQGIQVVGIACDPKSLADYFASQVNVTPLAPTDPVVTITAADLATITDAVKQLQNVNDLIESASKLFSGIGVGVIISALLP